MLFPRMRRKNTKNLWQGMWNGKEPYSLSNTDMYTWNLIHVLSDQVCSQWQRNDYMILILYINATFFSWGINFLWRLVNHLQLKLGRPKLMCSTPSKKNDYFFRYRKEVSEARQGIPVGPPTKKRKVDVSSAKILFHYHRGIVHKKQSLCKNHFTIWVCNLSKRFNYTANKKIWSHARTCYYPVSLQNVNI